MSGRFNSRIGLAWTGLAFLALLLTSAEPAHGQGLIAGTIRDADASIPTTAQLDIRIFPVEDPANAVTLPGAVVYRGAPVGAYQVGFTSFPQALTAGQTLRVEIENRSSGTLGSLDVPIVALDAAHVGDVVLRAVPPADVRIRTVTAPATVARGERGARVEVAVENAGGRSGSLVGARLILSLGGSDRTAADYIVSAATGNPTSLTAGATRILTFTVDVGASAATGLVAIDARADADADGADTKGQWTVERPALLNVVAVTAPTRVDQGQASVPVSFLVTNSGDRTGELTGVALALRQGNQSRDGDYTAIPAVSNAESLAPGQSTLMQFLVDVGATAAAGEVTVDGVLGADPDGATTKAVWTVGAVAILRVTAVELAASVAQATTGAAVLVRLANLGGAGAPLPGAGLSFVRGGLDASRDYVVSAQSTLPSTIGPLGSVVLPFEVDVSPVAATGAVTVALSLGRPLAADSAVGNWTVTRANLCPAANAGFARTVVATGSDVDVTVRLIGHDSADPDRPTTSSSVPTLEFAWRLIAAVSDAGALLTSSTPFLGGTTAALSGSGNAFIVDPPVRLRSAGRYTFGLTVTETGSAGPGNTGCSSSETRVVVTVRGFPAGDNTPPTVRARLIEPGSGNLVESLPVVLATSSVSIRLSADKGSAAAFDPETPEDRMQFSWTQLFGLPFGPNPPVQIAAASSGAATVTIAAPGVYGFAVTALDDGRATADGPARPASRLASLRSNAVTVVVRPAGNTFPVVSPPVARAEGSSAVVSFSSPAVIPATASNDTGGFPAVLLTASASDSETTGTALVYTWSQLSDGTPSVTLRGSDSSSARFIPTVSGTYRFRATVSDGVLSASADVAVPVDDLRPGGRVGVAPAINGLAGSSDSNSVGTFAPDSAITLDASGSRDRASDYGRAARPLTFSWSQLEGPASLSFDSSSGALVLQVPSGADGTYAFAVAIDNGNDAVQQQVQFLVLPASAGPLVRTGGGCQLGFTPASRGPLDLLVLLLPLAFLAKGKTGDTRPILKK
ncbi:MAG: hypothetical protein HY816_03820 [Candidatus Wallbacteria bacterium]|nr:hypothetical protein [Candidatus Wallbacteria bacterium]